MSWFDDNELINYPLVDLPENEIPADVFVDVFVHAPDGLGSRLEVFSVSLTPLVASVVISIDGVPVGFTTSVIDPSLVHTPQELTPIEPGVSGHITWGTGVLKHFLRVDGPLPLADNGLVSFPSDLEIPTAVLRGRDLNGIVQLRPGTGVTINAEDVVVLEEDGVTETEVTAAVIKLSADLALQPINPCEVSAEADLPAPPILSINGVRPDPTTGDIDLVGVVVKQLDSEPDITLDSPGDGVITITDHGRPCE